MDHLGGLIQNIKMEQLKTVAEAPLVLRSAHCPACIIVDKHFTEPSLFKCMQMHVEVTRPALCVLTRNNTNSLRLPALRSSPASI